MAKYRHIHTAFWDDPDMLEMTPEDKYFYLFLMTNPCTKQCGIYEMSLKQMEFYTGYNRDTVDKLLDRWENQYKRIVYSRETREVALRNWAKHNNSGSPGVERCIEKEIISVKNRDLIKFTHSQGTVPPTVRGEWGEKEKEKEKEKKKEKKKKTISISLSQFVSMTIGEYRKLYKEHGKDKTRRLINRLNAYKGSTGKTYKSDYMAMFSWVIGAVEKDSFGNKKTNDPSVHEQSKKWDKQ